MVLHALPHADRPDVSHAVRALHTKRNSTHACVTKHMRSHKVPNTAGYRTKYNRSTLPLRTRLTHVNHNMTRCRHTMSPVYNRGRRGSFSDPLPVNQACTCHGRLTSRDRGMAHKQHNTQDYVSCNALFGRLTRRNRQRSILYRGRAAGSSRTKTGST